METIEGLAKRMGEIAIAIRQHQEERNNCFTRIEELRSRERELDVRLMDLRAHLTRLSDRLVELHQRPVDAELTGNSLHRVFEDHDGRQHEVAEQARPWDLSPEERAEETEAKRRAEGKAMDSFHADDFKKTTGVFGPGSSELVDAYVYSQQQDQAGPVAGAVDPLRPLTDSEFSSCFNAFSTRLQDLGDQWYAVRTAVERILELRRGEQ